jgi:A/G-specific adenine glycosylase
VARDALPWRAATDPWLVLVSESMLAQTQVGRVAERYPTIVDRFPTPSSLAACQVGELIALWSGLGYYRRAVNLHAAARHIDADHGGVVPPHLDALLRLPGVGAYTARAVLAFSFDQPIGPIDTNIRRVLLRGFGFERVSSARAQAEADALASAIVSSDTARMSSREWSLALMDLGHGVCTARTPSCAACPIRASCAWRTAGGPDPASSARRRAPAPYANSDRELRGAVIRAACDGPISLDHVPSDAPRERVRGIVDALIAEGLVVERRGVLTLP